MKIFKIKKPTDSAPVQQTQSDWYFNVYLVSTHWLDVRKRYIKVHGNKCQECGSRNRLQLHHKTYERLWAERLTDLVMLCEVHHAEQHDIPEHIIKQRRQARLRYNRAVRNATYTLRRRLRHPKL
jgi:hypothetical protein